MRCLGVLRDSIVGFVSALCQDSGAEFMPINNLEQVRVLIFDKMFWQNTKIIFIDHNTLSIDLTSLNGLICDLRSFQEEKKLRINTRFIVIRNSHDCKICSGRNVHNVMLRSAHYRADLLRLARLVSKLC